MAFGLEARLPFLDHRLIEFALALPASYKIHAGWQKFIVRAALDEVPDTIRFRKDKMGFTTPTKAWIERYRTLFEARAQDALNEGFARPAGKHAFAERDHLALFRMACLGIWLETQKDARHRIPC